MAKTAWVRFSDGVEIDIKATRTSYGGSCDGTKKGGFGVEYILDVIGGDEDERISLLRMVDVLKLGVKAIQDRDLRLAKAMEKVELGKNGDGQECVVVTTSLDEMEENGTLDMHSAN